MTSHTTSAPTIRFGVCMILAGIGCAVVVHLHPEQLRTPAWIAFMAAALLGVGGSCVILSALRMFSLLRWVVCGLIAAMTAVPSWIAVSRTSTQCSFVSIGVRNSLSESGCRGAFGFGALVLLVLLIFAVKDTLRRRNK